MCCHYIVAISIALSSIRLVVISHARSVKENAALIKKAFTSDFVIPEFGRFTDIIDDMYRSCQSNTDGKVRLLVIILITKMAYVD